MNFKVVTWLLAFPLLMVALIFAFWKARGFSLESFYLTGFDSFIEIRVEAHELSKLRPEVEKLVSELDRKWNRFAPESEIYLLNNARRRVKLSPDTISVLQEALILQQKTGGYFNPFMASLVDAWGFSGDKPSVPDESTVRKLVLDVQKSSLVIDPENGEAQLLGSGSVDLGGIGKGYLADKISSLFRKMRISTFLINAGGTVLVSGREFRIGIKDPRGEGIIGSISLKEGAVATSGDYFRFFIADGKRYFHILNPFSGFPCRDFQSVTVVSREAALSDALATALMAGGREALSVIVQSFPAIGICIVDAEGKVLITPNMLSEFKFKVTKEINYYLLKADPRL
ncbi:FAD:protein FMN transferase [Thermatribacter velox]|uniref:FAD:protein FMN transferase n=1 Tax=Thermatribacter velox TaxID=3039681 RepID=A0ABZ2YFI0_9BACT